MTTTDFGASIGNLIDDNIANHVQAIKTAVADRFRETDSGVSVRTTEYFNHTYAPDLVLNWPADQTERRVFLRTSSNPDYLREDLGFIGANHPILMPLSTVRTESVREQEPSALEEESRRASILVTSPDTLAALEESRSERPVVGLLSRAVLQGGRGLVDEERARETGVALGLGFEAAGRADIEPTRRAVDLAETLLDSVRASSLTRLLQAVWLGSGAPSSSFPGPSPTTAYLDTSSLDFLLRSQDIDDAEFWRRIGAGLTLERLASLPSGSRSANLQRLIVLNSDRLRGKSCRVLPAGSDETEGMSWFVQDGLVVLEGARFRVFFSTGPWSEISLPEVSLAGISISDLRRRARGADVAIGEVDLSTGMRQLGYKSQADDDVAQDDDLLSIENLLGDAVVVRAATALLGGGSRQLRCNFERLAAGGRTAAMFYLSEMGLAALPLLHRLTDHEMDMLRAVFGRATEPVTEL